MILALITLAIHYKRIEAGNFFFRLRQWVVLVVFAAVFIVYLLCDCIGKALTITFNQCLHINRHIFFLQQENNPIDFTGFDPRFGFVGFGFLRRALA